MQTATRNGKFLDYRNALRDELHLTLPGANLTLTEVGWHATKRLPAHSLAFVVPPKYVLTVSEALGSGAGHYINANARSLPRTLPRHFVLAMWILQQKHVASVRSLWTRWIAALPPLDRSTLFWSEEELALLDEPRLIASTRARRKALALEYESMVKVLLHEGGMEEDAGDGAITLDEYMWAVCAVTATALHFADDFPVLTPLTLRFKPSAAVETYEYGVRPLSQHPRSTYASQHRSELEAPTMNGVIRTAQPHTHTHARTHARTHTAPPPLLKPLLPRPSADDAAAPMSSRLLLQDESDPGAALYVSASALGRGAELTVGAAMWNDQLMLHAGYLWDECAARRRSQAGPRAFTGKDALSVVRERDAGLLFQAYESSPGVVGARECCLQMPLARPLKSARLCRRAACAWRTLGSASLVASAQRLARPRRRASRCAPRPTGRRRRTSLSRPPRCPRRCCLGSGWCASMRAVPFCPAHAHAQISARPCMHAALMPASEVAHLQLNDLFEARNISLEREVVRIQVVEKSLSAHLNLASGQLFDSFLPFSRTMPLPALREVHDEIVERNFIQIPLTALHAQALSSLRLIAPLGSLSTLSRRTSSSWTRSRCARACR
eukprot:6181492-Pleurochrysis_carterae.AAC.1